MRSERCSTDLAAQRVNRTKHNKTNQTKGMKLKKYALLVAIATSSSQAIASDDVVVMSAIKYYAEKCYAQQGTSYISNDQGYSWEPVNYEEVSFAAKYGKGMIVINSMGSKQRITDAQVDEYIKGKLASTIQLMEENSVLTCQRNGSGISISYEQAESNSTKASTASTDPKIPFVGDKYFNLAGGRGTEYVLSISANGQVKVYHSNTPESPEYSGPLTSPINANGWLLAVKGNKIYEVDESGGIKHTCFDGEQECVSELY